MSDKPNWEEFGKPCIDSGGEKTVTKIYDERYGEYDHPSTIHDPPNGGSNPAEKLNPQPFTLTK